jgi:hypothetical protein
MNKWICFGPVFHPDGRLSTDSKCQSCVIIRKPCKGGAAKVQSSDRRNVAKTEPAGDTIHIRTRSSAVESPKKPLPLFVQGGSKDPVSFERVYGADGAPLGRVTRVSLKAPPIVDLSLTRKRSALAAPTTAEPSSAKTLRTSQSTSAIQRTSSAISSASSHFFETGSRGSVPSPLGLSMPLPQMAVDTPEDPMMVLLDALEFSAQKGNMVDVFRRIESLRSLRRLEKANPKA